MNALGKLCERNIQFLFLLLTMVAWGQHPTKHIHKIEQLNKARQSTFYKAYYQTTEHTPKIPSQDVTISKENSKMKNH